jgi:STE24 endopeptidase
MLRRSLAILTLSTALSIPALAQAPAPPAPATAETTTGATAPAQATATPAVASVDTGRVAVPAPSEKAVRYHRSGNWVWVIGVLWGLLVPALILFTGVSARLRTVAQRIGRKWFFTLAIYLALLSLVFFILNLPLAYYVGFVREHAYGLSNQTLGKWFGDSLKALAIGILFTPLILWVPYLLIRRSPKRWWLYSTLAAVPLIVFVIWAVPVFVDPLFNRFGPMDDKGLESQILALADRAGIEGARVFEVDKSVDTNAVNAYVTGFGDSKRIVLWDTLLRKLAPRETLFVMGHEMGHYVLGHILLIIVLGSVLTLVSLYAIHRTAGWFIARWRRRFGFDELGDVASYPLLILVTGIVGLAVTPVLNVVTRHFEHEADRFGLELTRDNHAAASAFVKLQEENLAVPYPGAFYKLWRSSHPVLGERTEFANEYRPWETGQPLKYGEHFDQGR